MNGVFLSLFMLAGGVLVRAILFGITEEAASSSVASVADVLGSLLEAYGTSTVGIQRAGERILKCVDWMAPPLFRACVTVLFPHSTVSRELREKAMLP